MLQSETRTPLGVTCFLVGCLSVGFWLRVRHLGDLGLVVDEGFQGLAVQGILEHGLPQVDSGLLYPRSLPFSYLQAATARLFGMSEFALRLPGVLLSVATILVSYHAGKMVFNRWVGLLTAAVMTCSVWEIEMARYARSYAAFQLMYLVAFVCFYQGFIVGKRASQSLFVGAAFIAFSLHELGLMLVSWFVIPLFATAASPQQKRALLWWAGGLLAVCLGYLRVFGFYATIAGFFPRAGEGGASLGILEILEKVTTIVTARVSGPDLSLLSHTAQQRPLMLLGLASAVGGVTLLLLSSFFRKNAGWRSFVAVLIIWAAFLHQFGIVMVLGVVSLACFARDLRSLGDPPLNIAFGMGAVCLVFWGVMLGEGRVLPLRQALFALFDYPHLYRYFLSWFVLGWPLLTLVFSIGCVRLLTRFLADRRTLAPLFLLGAIFVPAVLTSFLRAPYYEARYTFHLYPLMVIIFAAVIVEGGIAGARGLSAASPLRRRALIALLGIAALFLSQDANPLDAWAVGNRTYRSTTDPIRGHINWKLYAGFHQDHKSPSLYVRERLAPGDRVVAFGPPHMIAVYHYYIGQVDYAVGRPRLEDKRHRLREGSGKVADYMTGSTVLESLSAVQRLVAAESEGGLWVLGDRMLLAAENPSYTEPTKAYLRALAREPDYLGLDGQTFVVKVR